MAAHHSNSGKSKKSWGLKASRKLGISEGPASSGNADLDAAIEQFGKHGFQEEKWVHEFLQKHAVNELPEECNQLEKWIDVIKDGLRGAVLEQYEYFVEASRNNLTSNKQMFNSTLSWIECRNVLRKTCDERTKLSKLR